MEPACTASFLNKSIEPIGYGLKYKVTMQFHLVYTKKNREIKSILIDVISML